jgi:predicted  nucleic acid-binding Zn-ribbon protein
MRKTLAVAALLLLTTACVSKKEYDAQMAQSAALSAEKDSLLSEVVATSQFISDVNAEIDKVRSGAPVASRANEMETLTPQQAREQLMGRVTELTTRVREAENRMSASRRRIAALTAGNADLTKKFDSTVAAFQLLVDNQKAEIVALLDQVSALTAQNAQLREANAALATERASLSASNEMLTAEKNTVYWVAGTKDELLRRGIIEQRGGLLGIGRTLVLARTLDAAEFTASDRTGLLEVTLPDAARSYRMVSPNDVTGLDGAPADGKFQGAIKISAPEVFWRTSRFLVLVQN